MKLCFKKLFLLSIICVPFLLFDSSVGGQIHDEVLLADGTANGEEQGGNVLLSGTGYINLTYNGADRKLKFEVCKICTGMSTICYEALDGQDDPEAYGSCDKVLPSSCEFKVDGNAEKLKFGILPVFKSEITTSCLQPVMHHPLATVGSLSSFKSCSPKFDNNKMIKLHVTIPETCKIKVLNAAVHVPEVLSTPSLSSAKLRETTPSSSKESSADASFPWWGYLCIGLVILVAAIVICIVVYIIFFKKRQSSKAAPPPATTPITALSNPNVTTPAAAPAAVASNDTPSSKRKANLNFTKFEPTVPSTRTSVAETIQQLSITGKKGKKKKAKKVTTTQEPSTTEDAPPPLVSKKPQTKPSPTVYGKAPRLVPRSMKSAKTDSLDMTLKKDKMEMVESVVESVERNCLKSSDSEMVQEMKDKYPEMKHLVRVSEIELLCVPVSKMIVKLDTLAREYEQKLSDTGCKFDQNRRLTYVSGRGRSLLQKEKTYASTVYFAFGAEYHRLISDKDFESYSIPLLMVFALQTRFPDQSRRKACAMMRRKIPIVLGSFPEAARRKMPFPMNIIEDAYCRDPIMFRNLSVIQTDSEDYRKKKQLKEGNY